MYKTAFEDIKKVYQPMIELGEIGKKTAETMLKEYSEYSRELVSSSINQAKQLASAKDIVAAFDAQAVYAKNLDSKFVSNAQKQMGLMLEARDASSKVFDELSDAYSSAMKSWMTQFKA
ncbi:hypothetical protein WH50_12340 [Pokkaliibacter plantistimulans]|uniref:Phasin domain-containing protein n=2 Tax=Pseudomonadota TaxID=1224 RepID=A0ABX5M2A9_9GAMM|nr:MULTISPECIES: phasin family protein [Pokkaliibacter]MDH2434434.1 phasin family protein [Pokkaliibacter sp. MBI-7]PPC79283.1 hypothetical protein C4K68_00840 [Pokkaliibacter plantistimulans]PXF31020.1 hypothetical protein WH50_12340 [Pokkaliibacter plantistimulans]